jgi:nucleoid DNA-binding protein
VKVGLTRKIDYMTIVHSHRNLPKGAKEGVDCVFETITKALKKKDAVTLVGFGTFKVSKRKARKGRNPKTGEVIKIKAKNVPRFVPGKGLKDVV